MEAREISAQFAAYVWFTGNNGDAPATSPAALRFARDNWETFLPCSHEGLGRLLIRIAGPRRRNQSPRRRQTAAGAC